MIWQSDTKLYDQNTFYDKFTKDLLHAKTRVIIESPFMTKKRINAGLIGLISTVDTINAIVTGNSFTINIVQLLVGVVSK